jgi:hypothetical protein
MHLTFVWRGKGYLVPAIVFFVGLALNLATNLMWGEAYWDNHAWPVGCEFILSGGLIWVVERQLAKQAGRVLIDEQTGQRVVLSSNHQFFWIPMKWWGVILVGIGIVVWAARVAPGRP